MKKVVVFGGAGFIGSHTADELSSQGYQVVIFDRKKPPYLRDDQYFVIGDILNQNDVKRVLKGASLVYHFAGIADIGESSKRPYETININIMGVANVLREMVNNNVKRLIYASTMYVYSHQGSFYRTSKQASEKIIESYSEEFGIDYTFLRYGSLYGPRSQCWNGLRGYVDQILRDKKIDYWGDGNEKREYIHVKDASSLSVDILNGDYINSAVTLTGNQLISSDELFSMIFEIIGINKNVNYRSRSESSGHYLITPYRYTPKAAKKITSNKFVDLGQGILDLVEELHSK